MTSSLGLITFEPLLLEKPWGGTRLHALVGATPSATPVGEAWLCADLASTSATGAGGGAIRSVVAHGPWRGHSLADVMRDHAEAILGAPQPDADAPQFPLLFKLLDAERNLSVQVHPSAEYAAEHPGAFLKSEAWYILESRGGRCYAGLTDIASRAALLEAARAESLLPHLVTRDAAAGDAIMIPSGVVHALGAGLTVFEVQTASDTTYRLYDWSRETGLPSRALHLEESAAAARLDQQPRWSRAKDDAEPVVQTEHFTLYALRGASLPPLSALRDGGQGRRCLVVVPIGGAVTLRAGAESVSVPAQHAALVPAALERVELQRAGATEVLVTRVELP
ncbi:hypothetical protein Strain138_001779 [Pseudogemmatithrix spongiicola]|uniref:Phosphomannose isomerase type I catalytic domain-containing protein n=1 Tax=Pseudogemmatithrix spongiicola TaxID=3062599 RepID=A0AA49K1A3_9BACT|nr:hypothetical protein Strain138_001779 [Gemmatimonadaceae bacterium 'strain 138']WKW15393.1 hypothetical protein Strain318_001778 [Gemmatimonadaceae bacterium 'strain 318']